MLLEVLAVGGTVLLVTLVPVLRWVHSVNRGFRRLNGWQETTERCGLTVVKTSNLVLVSLTARSGPVEIELNEQDTNVGMVVTVQGPPELSQVAIRRELIKRPRKHEIEIGDGGFDDTFLVQGPLPFVCALLDAPVRRMLREASTEHKLAVADGKIRISLREEELPFFLGHLRDLGQRFAETGDVPQRLAQNVEKDPEPGVRLLNLRVLVREYPDSPSTAAALRAASRDARAQVRLQAALEMGAEGQGILLELAETLEDDAVSASAVTALGSTLPLERLQSILAGARQRHRIETASACLAALGGLGGAAVETLAQVLENDRWELRAAAARALGATGDPAAEPPLLAALERDIAPLQTVAAEALSRVGSVAAVLSLQEASERTADLHKAAHQAIAAIQARLKGAEPGQLTLATAEGGELSMAPHEVGQLSVAPDPAGRLSIPPERAR